MDWLILLKIWFCTYVAAWLTLFLLTESQPVLQMDEHCLIMCKLTLFIYVRMLSIIVAKICREAGSTTIARGRVNYSLLYYPSIGKIKKKKSSISGNMPHPRTLGKHSILWKWCSWTGSCSLLPADLASVSSRLVSMMTDSMRVSSQTGPTPAQSDGVEGFCSLTETCRTKVEICEDVNHRWLRVCNADK